MSYAYSAYGDAQPLPTTATVTPSSTTPSSGPAWLGPVLVVGIFGLVGFALYKSYKVSEHIAKTEGSSGLLKYHAGSAAISAAERLFSPPRRNGRRHRANRRRR